jgi:hypothetical protein
MSKRLKRNAKLLQTLAKSDNSIAASIVRGSKSDLICCISDICFNILHDKVHLNKSDKKKLSKYKNDIRKLSKKSTTQKTKKEILQKGGFLQTLLAPLLSTVIAPLAKAIFSPK